MQLHLNIFTYTARVFTGDHLRENLLHVRCAAEGTPRFEMGRSKLK